ncbi:MAG: SPOR domain-containing protein [Bacteroidia bacterium]|nr:SPOR domain-containing protein [Bacteroidia bacterium]
MNKIIFLFATICFLFSNQLFSQTKGKLEIQSSEKIKNIIKQKEAYNKNLKYIKGFKIQLFNGSEQGAYKTREDFSTMFPDIEIKIQFFSPEWKVRVGNYKNRLDADRALFEIKQAFPNAIILPAMIDI